MFRWLPQRPRDASYPADGRRRRFSPDTRAILATSLLALVDGALEQGFSRADIMANLDCAGEELRPMSRVSWRDLTRAIENLERAGMTPDGFERAGEHVARTPHFGVQAFADFFLRPEHILFIGLKWVGPAVFPVLRSRVALRGSVLRLELDVPSDFPGSVGYFHICRGTLAGVPPMVGQPRAAVAATIETHRATFDIECAPMVPGSWRIGRVLRAMSSAPRVIEALTRQDKAIQRALELSAEHQEQFRRILGVLPDAVVVIHDDRISYANPTSARLLGFERPSELMGRSWSRLIGLDGPLTEVTERRVSRADGSSRWLELSPRQSIDYEGTPSELIVARDVTERHEFHQKLALTDRVTTLGTLAAGLAHEINNPLALVISNLELASRSRRGDPLLAAATEGAERVRAIVQELSVFSKPESEQRTPIDLAEVVVSTVALARGKARTRALIEVESRGTPFVLATRGRLGQVVLNLILNALDAMPDGRRVEDNRIVIRTMGAPLGAAVEVSDNGVGIPPDVQRRMFEPFFTTRSNGSGLGLAVVHDIVSSLGGSIEVTSAPARGTTVRIELPLAEVGGPTEEARSVETAPRGARILVADDEVGLLSVLERALSAAGYSVHCVSSGTEALEALRNDGAFDVILCDLMMPGRSGAELYADVVRERAELASRIVFMTGGAFRAEAREFLAGVQNRCLAKPFALADLSQVVAEVLSQRAREDSNL